MANLDTKLQGLATTLINAQCDSPAVPAKRGNSLLSNQMSITLSQKAKARRPSITVTRPSSGRPASKAKKSGMGAIKEQADDSEGSDGDASAFLTTGKAKKHTLPINLGNMIKQSAAKAFVNVQR